MTVENKDLVSHINEGDFLNLLRDKRLGLSPETLRQYFIDRNLGMLVVPLGPKKHMRMYPVGAVKTYVAQKEAERTTSLKEAQAAAKPAKASVYDFASMNEKMDILAATIARQNEIIIAIANSFDIILPPQEVQNVPASA